MKWQIVCVGKPALTWAKAGLEDYQNRLKRTATVDFTVLREGGTASETAKKMLAASEDSIRIVLDERGKQISSMAFASWIDKHQQAGTKRVSFLIGGANGHSEEVRTAAHEVWSLSTMTLQHELALVVLMEQLYRAYSILGGSPYHRE
jgi:23S rRNA (pseudouridine1915-N3)-methyltransferase